MLVLIENNIIIAKITTSEENEEKFLKDNPTYIKTNFKFEKDFTLYEYKNETFSLIENWEEKEKELQTIVEDVEVPDIDLEELKLIVINELNEKSNLEYQNYLSSYPTIEKETFPARNEEALNYMADNTSPTPIIDASLKIDFTEDERINEINAVYEKVKYISFMGGQVRDLREIIKNCKTIEELEDLRKQIKG